MTVNVPMTRGGNDMAGTEADHTSHMTRILLVDDHPIVRQGIKQVLSGAFSPAVVGEAANAEEGLTEVRKPRGTSWSSISRCLASAGLTC